MSKTKSRKPKQLTGTLRIKHWFDGHSFILRINERRWTGPITQDRVCSAVRNWSSYWTRSNVWNKFNYKGSKMIRVLIKKELPFEVHVVVNPTDKLDVPKLETDGFYHVGDYDNEKQIDDAVSVVATYLELEESHS